MRVVAIAVLWSASLLIGCGTMANRAGVGLLPAETVSQPDTGVVLFSVGAPDHCVSTATFLSVVGESNQGPFKSPPIGVDVYVHKSEFADHHGLVNAIAYPAGKYYFAPHIANPYVSNRQTPTFHFEVVPGELTYIGELFMEQSCALNGRFEIRDQFDRDVAMARAKNATLMSRPVVKRLMQLGQPIRKD
jgi:hypothetical protein